MILEHLSTTTTWPSHQAKWIPPYAQHFHEFARADEPFIEFTPRKALDSPPAPAAPATSLWYNSISISSMSLSRRAPAARWSSSVMADLVADLVFTSGDAPVVMPSSAPHNSSSVSGCKSRPRRRRNNRGMQTDLSYVATAGRNNRQVNTSTCSDCAVGKYVMDPGGDLLISPVHGTRGVSWSHPATLNWASAYAHRKTNHTVPRYPAAKPGRWVVESHMLANKGLPMRFSAGNTTAF